MKKILIGLTFTFATLVVSSASAVTVAGINFADNAIADVATGSNSQFLNWNPTYDETGISAAQLSADMTDTSAGTYVFSFDAGAYIDMSFSSVDVYNGEGNDLALFFVGSDAQTGTLNLLGTEYSTAFTTPVFTGESVTELFNDINGNPVISPIYVSYFDLDVFGIDNQTAINNFRLEIGNGSAVPALLAAINTSPGTTPVPVPAPFLLLLSGLAGLGFFGRKKK
ncbi:hypothetical protein MNBD_GAMMA08-3003 [hydrothermal vent metagenome]|uniref:PEP-CTERM protein-sorting domain-containing protein n=1 Tax=hydrothermal vent metagenome TaxID=652676 RepID=A0A3B0XME3_9ZZZZ